MFRVESTNGSNPFNEQFRIHRYWLQVGFVVGALFTVSLVFGLQLADRSWFKGRSLDPAPSYGAYPNNPSPPFIPVYEPNEAAQPNEAASS